MEVLDHAEQVLEGGGALGLELGLLVLRELRQNLGAPPLRPATTERLSTRGYSWDVSAHFMSKSSF